MKVIMPPILADFGDSFWLPTRASSYASGVDSVFNFIFWVSAFFFVLVVALMLFFVVRYRYRKGKTQPKVASHNTPLEVVWTIIPTIIVIIIFYLGHRAYVRMTVVPPGTTDQIDVWASMWNWQFTYQPSGFSSDELHLPLNVPVRLLLHSNDVIHGFFIPDFRIKKDVVPGRTNEVWIRATEVGTYDLYCSQFCGTRHSEMRAKVVVQDPDEFNRWLQQQISAEANLNPVEMGRNLYHRRSCAQCHSIDGTRITGPTFKDLYGSTQHFTDGSSAVVDDPYIRHFVRNPQQRIPVGYDPVMTAFGTDVLSEKDLDGIIAFMKSISVHYSGDRSALTRPSTQPATQPSSK